MLVKVINSIDNFLTSTQIDFAYIYSDLRIIARDSLLKLTKEEICSELINVFLAHNVTVVVPSFTYTMQGTFDPKLNINRLSTLSRFIQISNCGNTSNHPIFSFSAIGSKSNIVNDIAKSAFGYDSVFERLKLYNTVLFHIGRSVGEGQTLVHHVEQLCGAWYRTNVVVPTVVMNGLNVVGNEYSAFLRRRDIPGQSFATQYWRASNHLERMGIVEELLGGELYKNLSLVPYKQAFDELCRLFQKDNEVFL